MESYLSLSELRFFKCLNSILDQGISIFHPNQITVDFNDQTIIIRGHAYEIGNSLIVKAPVIIHTYAQLNFTIPEQIDSETVEQFICNLYCIPHRFLSHRIDMGDHKRIGNNPFDRSNTL